MNFKIIYDRLKKRFSREHVAQANDSDVLVLIDTHQQLFESLKKMLFGRKTEKRPLDSNYDLPMFGEPEAQREARKR